MKWPALMQWLRPKPEPPQNVRLVYPDGTEVPVGCVYRGRRKGQHRWVAMAPSDALAEGATLKADRLPARTSIQAAFVVPRKD